MTTLLRSALTPLAMGALLLALAGCGDSDSEEDTGGDSGGETGATVLTDEQASSALLTIDDVPEGFAEDEDENEDDQLGCLDVISDLTEADADTEAESQFATEDGGVGIISGIKSYEADVDATEELADFGEEISECTSVDETQDEIRAQLDVTSDVADDEISVEVSGTVSGATIETLPYDLVLTATRVDNNLAIVGAFELAEAGVVAEADALNQTVLDRLTEAAAG